MWKISDMRRRILRFEKQSLVPCDQNRSVTEPKLRFRLNERVSVDNYGFNQDNIEVTEITALKQQPWFSQGR